MMSLPRRLLAATTLAVAQSASFLWAGQPCNCEPYGPAPVHVADGVPRDYAGVPPGYDGAPPPAVIFAEPPPCVFKPYDLNPCYDYRCDLFPGLPPLTFYVQADLAPLYRDVEQEVFFQALGAQGPAVLGTQTLDMEFQGGLQLLVGGRIDEMYRLESTFLGFQHWAESDTVRDFSPNAFGTEGNLFSPFANFGDPALNLDDPNPADNPDADPAGILGLDFNTSAQLSLQTSFDSAGMSFLVDIPRIRNLESAAMLGWRFVRIEEALSYATTSAEPLAAGGASVAIQNALNNEMLGLQLGYRARFYVEPRSWLDFEVKGAIYDNDIDYRLRYQQTQGAATVGAFADAVEDEKTTFGGDLSLVLHYLVAPNFAVRLGYQALWFDGVALAAQNVIPEDVRVTTPAGGPNTLVFPPLEVEHDGEVVYHGPVAGFVIMW